MGCARPGRASRAKQSMHYCAYLGHAREGGGGHDRPASRPKHRPSKAWAGMARQPMSRVCLGQVKLTKLQIGPFCMTRWASDT
jgi:hypothetical protein